MDSCWAWQCLLGPLKPGQARYCKRDITPGETGLNLTMGRVQGRYAIRCDTEVVNISKPYHGEANNIGNVHPTKYAI